MGLKKFEVTIELAGNGSEMNLIVMSSKEENIDRDVKRLITGLPFIDGTDYKIIKIRQVVVAAHTMKLDDALVAAVARQYGWYIENAIRVRIERDKENVASAKKTLASAENDGSAPYRSLEGMVDYFEPVLRDFTDAYKHLEDVGIFPGPGW